MNAKSAALEILDPDFDSGLSCGLRKLCSIIERGESAQVPEELRVIAERQNHSPHIVQNADMVAANTYTQLKRRGYGQVKVQVGLFDHNRKHLYLFGREKSRRGWILD